MIYRNSAHRRAVFANLGKRAAYARSISEPPDIAERIDDIRRRQLLDLMVFAGVDVDPAVESSVMNMPSDRLRKQLELYNMLVFGSRVGRLRSRKK